MRYSKHMDVGEKNKQKRFGRKKLVIISIAVAVALAGAGAYSVHKSSTADPIPAAIHNQVTFSLYYPAKLPAGWRLDQHSFKVANGVLFYLLHGPKGDLTVTVQSRPPTFDYPSFYEKGLTGTFQFATPAGQAAIGHTVSRLLGSLVGEDSWVLISPSTPNVTQEDIQTVLNGLTKSKTPTS
jgi:hypothetical protein